MKIGDNEVLKGIASICSGQKRFARFYKYLFSYIVLIIILLVAVSAVVYWNFISELQKQTENSNINALEQIKNTMDTRFKEMNRTTVQIMLNPKLRPFKIINGGYDSYEAIQEMNKYVSANAFVNDIILYYNYNGEDKICTSDNISNLDNFFNDRYSNINWSKDDFIASINADRVFPMMRPVETVFHGGVKEQNVATYIYPLPVSTIGKPFGAVIFMIDDQNFESMFNSVLKGYEGYAYMLDQDRRIIVSSVSSGERDYDVHAVMEQLKPALSKTVSDLPVNGEQFSVVNIMSDYNGWSYVVAIPTAQFMQRVHYSRKLFNYSIIGILILGVFMAFLFTNRNYKPLQNLVAIIKGQNRYKYETKGIDEIDLIACTINEMASETNNLMFQLKSCAGMIKDELLLTLLKGKFKSKSEIEKLLDASGIKLDKSYFAVLLFIIDDYAAFTKANNRSMQDILKYTIVNALEELSGDIGYGYGIDLADEGSVAILLNFDNVSDVDKKISDLAYKAKDFFKQYFDFTLSVGVGNSCESISMICKSMDEASKAAYCRFVRGRDQVIFYNDIKVRQREEYWYSMEYEAPLIMAIRQGRGDEAVKIVDAIIIRLKESQPSSEMAKYVCWSMVNTVFKAMEGLNITEEDCFDGVASNGLLTLAFDTIEDAQERIKQLCETVCHHIQRCKESKNFDLLDKIKAFVHEHYCDDNIYLQSIAAEVQLSASYITRFFKDQTGISLMHYIDALRMERVKELLKGTDLPLRDIMDKVGYVDENNFIRKFRKNEGVTPMQYRKIARDNDVPYMSLEIQSK